MLQAVQPRRGGRGGREPAIAALTRVRRGTWLVTGHIRVWTNHQSTESDMTPSQLRVRAYKNLESAKLLLPTDPDNASNLLGQAVELALKARYCTRRGLGDFPETLQALRAAGIGEIATHDLDQLLTLARGVFIVKTGNVNWNNASDWHVGQRYHPVGSVVRSTAQAQFDETWSVLDSLSLYELLESLMRVRVSLETRLATSMGAFALVPVSGTSRWRVLLGGAIIWSTGRERFADMFREVSDQHVDIDLCGGLDESLLLVGNNSMLEAFAWLDRSHAAGIVRVTDSLVFRTPIKLAYLIPNRSAAVNDSGTVHQCVFQ